MLQPASFTEKARTGVRRRDLRLLPLAGGVWAAALLCVFVPASSWWVVGGCVVGAVFTVIVAVRGSSRWRQGAGLVVLLLAAMAATAVTASLALPARERAAEWSGRVVEVTAEVTSSASVGQDGQLWFDA